VPNSSDGSQVSECQSSVPLVTRSIRIGRVGLIVAILWLSASAKAVAQERAREIPRSSTPQFAACHDQPQSLRDLIAAFSTGRSPAAPELDGAWIAIGFVGDYSSLNCDGVTRGDVFEWVMIADQYSVDIDAIGAGLQRQAFVPDDSGSVTLTVDFGGDTSPVYRCRLTSRGTLACLLGESAWTSGVEFRRGPVRGEQRANREVDVP
jgi:hypothetical protein